MKIVLILISLLFTLNAMNLGWSNNYEKALKNAKVENKLVYVLITSDNCRWCRKFEMTTLQDKQIKERLKKQFITIHLSRERDVVPSYFKTAPIPRHYFVDGVGNILYSSLGYRDAEVFNIFMDYAQDNYKKEIKDELNKNK
ncbi:DUF255 domain-containing protein [Sulfurimonas sp.]